MGTGEELLSFTGCRHQGSETKSISHDSACRAAISLSRGIYVGSSGFYIPISPACTYHKCVHKTRAGARGGDPGVAQAFLTGHLPESADDGLFESLAALMGGAPGPEPEPDMTTK